jgi:hypothetical protein
MVGTAFLCQPVMRQEQSLTRFPLKNESACGLKLSIGSAVISPVLRRKTGSMPKKNSRRQKSARSTRPLRRGLSRVVSGGRSFGILSCGIKHESLMSTLAVRDPFIDPQPGDEVGVDAVIRHVIERDCERVFIHGPRTHYLMRLDHWQEWCRHRGAVVAVECGARVREGERRRRWPD